MEKLSSLRSDKTQILAILELLEEGMRCSVLGMPF